MDRYDFGIEFQKTILTLILTDNEVVSGLRSVIDPDYFTDSLLRKVARDAIRFTETYPLTPAEDEFIEFTSTIDNTNPDERDIPIEDLRELITDLYAKRIKNKKFLRNKIIEFAQFRAMKDAILSGSEMIGSHENHLEIRKLINEALKVGIDISELGTNLVEDREKRFNLRSLQGLDYNKIPTGIPKLDRIMRGGLDQGELGVILAPPKGFKTGSLVNLGFAGVASRHNVVHISLEISEPKMVLRYERRAAGLTKPEIITDWKKLDSSLRRIDKIGGGLVVKGFPMRSIGVSGISNYIDQLASEGFKSDLIIVDYGDLIKPPPESSREVRHQLAQIYADLRAMGQEKKNPVWTASQANRKATSKRVIRKEDIAEAWEKVAIADIVIAICQTKEERKLTPSRARLFIAANREEEEGGTVYCSIDYDRMRIRQLEKEDYYDE